MTAMSPTARRTMIAGLLGGAAVTATAPAASAAGTPTGVLAYVRDLAAGDVVLGPHAQIVRISSRTVLASGRHRLRYSDPDTGLEVAFDAAADTLGYLATQQLLLLARAVPLKAVRLTSAPAVVASVIDGGRP